MDNTREALEYAVELSKPEIFTIGEETFASQKLVRIEEKQDDLVDSLKVSTLTGFIDYIINNRDKIDLSKTLAVIGGTSSVSLISIPNKDKKRETYIKADAIVPRHNWGDWEGSEDFVIGLQSRFADSNDKEVLMQYVGNMQEDEGVQTMDDGVSQKIVAKTGIANMSQVILPNPVVLRPFRTFQEVEQVESNFIFRVKKGGHCALFEADGGEWAIRCRQVIKQYLLERLSGVAEIVIIG